MQTKCNENLASYIKTELRNACNVKEKEGCNIYIYILNMPGKFHVLSSLFTLLNVRKSTPSVHPHFTDETDQSI